MIALIIVAGSAFSSCEFELDFDFEPRCDRGPIGSIRFVDRPAAVANRDALRTPGRWLILDENENVGRGVISLASLDQPDQRPLKLFGAEQGRLSPAGRYLLLVNSGTDLVVRMNDLRIVAEITGVASRVAFAGPSSIAVSLSTNGCKFQRLVVGDLEKRTQSRVLVTGLYDGMVPVGAIGAHLIYERVLKEDLDIERPAGWGVGAVSLQGGNARSLADDGEVAALVQSEGLVWTTTDIGADAIDLFGARRASLPGSRVRAAEVSGGRVAYVPSPNLGCVGFSFSSPTTGSPNLNTQLRLAQGSGPSANDPSVPIGCVDADLGVSPDGNTVFVSASSLSLTASAAPTASTTTTPIFPEETVLLACSVQTLGCFELATGPEFEFASVRGVITTPIGLR